MGVRCPSNPPRGCGYITSNYQEIIGASVSNHLLYGCSIVCDLDGPLLVSELICPRPNEACYRCHIDGQGSIA